MSTKGDMTSREPTLDPGYGIENKPTTADPLKSKTDLKIEAILDDVRNRTVTVANGNSIEVKSDSSPPTGETFTSGLKRMPTGSTDAKTGLNPTADANPVVRTKTCGHSTE